jgi:pyridoxamine 5'-phosphate oxidase
MNDELDEHTIARDPIKQFRAWFDDARSAKIMLPEAMTLATISDAGNPSARMVLLKTVDERGFIFYTNYLSTKSRELEGHPHAALVFHWDVLQRQVRISGTVTKISAEESDAYFRTRPRESQIGAHTSQQSSIVANREELETEYKRIEKMYEGKSIPRPVHWGGYCLSPKAIEFWKGRIGRLHDRILYEIQPDNRWIIKRLAP